MEYSFKKQIRKALLPVGLLIASFAFNSVNAQTNYHATAAKTVLEGTSNIHDWTMQSQKATATAVVTLAPTGTLASITSINFVMPAESLKSEHAQMDKNSYKALKTSKNPNISFSASSATVKPNGANGFTLVSRGKLNISGVTKDVDLVASGVVNADKSITLNGTYKFKMTDFQVTPPSLMMGAIKTGDGIAVKYNLTLKAH